MEIIARCSLRRFWLPAVMALVLAQPVGATEPDWSTYGELLKNYTTPIDRHGISYTAVNYAALPSDPRYLQVVAALAAFNPAQLQGQAEQLAFYINAYNILAVKTIVDHWPVASIKDLGGTLLNQVWDQPAGQIGGKTYTLNQVEHEILRKQGEPRIHLAIVCASKSCPDLRNEPYRAARLNEQLEQQSQSYLANASKGCRVEQGKIHVSKIFRWFKGDFKAQGGVEAFVRRYRPDLPKDAEVTADLPYDWTVNGG